MPTPPPRLEGYLFPETYEVPQKVSGPKAAEMMVRMFSQRVGTIIRSQPESKLTPHQVLTLASIVEREAKQPSERPLIASVYLNRLAADLPLQADPTVQYALATRDGPAAGAYHYWKQDLTPADLQIDSPFNTYVISGLPPGPICNPGEPSIRAVLQPAKTDYLYFVATTDGSGTHLFARTLRRAQRQRRQSQRSLRRPLIYSGVYSYPTRGRSALRAPLDSLKQRPRRT